MLFRSSERVLKYDKNGLIPAIIQDAENYRVLIHVYLNREAVKKTRKTGELWLYYRGKKKIWRKGSRSGRTMKVLDIIVHHDRNILLIKVIPNGPACHTGNETCFLESIMHKQDAIESRYQEEMEEGEKNDGLDPLRQIFESQNLSNEVEIVSAKQIKKSIKKTEQSSLSIEFESDDLFYENNLLKEIYFTIQQKIKEDQKNSYTAKIASLGGEKIAQRVGENAIHLLMNVSQKDHVGIVKKEAEIIHNMLILLAEKQIKIDYLQDELSKRVV